MSVAPEGYPGRKYRGRYAYDHKISYWVKTGESVPSGFVLHHKNGDKYDNRFENLELLKPEAHSRLHGFSQKKTKTRRFSICPSCNEKFEEIRRPVQRFCSRRCIGLYNFPSRVA